VAGPHNPSRLAGSRRCRQVTGSQALAPADRISTPIGSHHPNSNRITISRLNDLVAAASDQVLQFLAAPRLLATQLAPACRRTILTSPTRLSTRLSRCHRVSLARSPTLATPRATQFPLDMAPEPASDLLVRISTAMGPDHLRGELGCRVPLAVVTYGPRGWKVYPLAATQVLTLTQVHTLVVIQAFQATEDCHLEGEELR
jgi:hypothetical protein